MEDRNLNKLNRLFHVLKKTKTPSFSGNDELDDWIEDLIEIDAIFAGLACSLLGGEKITQNQIPEIKTLKEDFSNISEKREIDLKKIKQCEIYLDVLLKLHEQLLRLSKRTT